MSLLEYWSRFGSEASHTKRVLTFFTARLKNAKQKVKLTKIIGDNGWVCLRRGCRFYIHSLMSVAALQVVGK